MLSHLQQATSIDSLLHSINRFVTVFSLNELGVSAYTVGIWGQRLGLKAPHGMRGPYGYWKNNQYFYNEQGIQMLLDHKDEITYRDSDF